MIFPLFLLTILFFCVDIVAGASTSAANVSAQVSNIPMLNGTNFKV